MNQAEEHPSEQGRELATFGRTDAQEQEESASNQWESLEFQSMSPPRSLWVVLLGAVGLVLAGFIAYLAIIQRPTVRSGTVESIEQGTLQISRGQGQLWEPAEEGQTIPQGVTVRSTKDTWATIGLPDQSLMRVEASGVWKMVDVVEKGNHLRITIGQKAGKASFVSPPPHRSGVSQFSIQVPGATTELLGVGTFITTSDERTRVQILQGNCTLKLDGTTTKVSAGETATIDPTSGNITITESN